MWFEKSIYYCEREFGNKINLPVTQMGRMYRIRHLRITPNEKDCLYSNAEKAQGKK